MNSYPLSDEQTAQQNELERQHLADLDWHSRLELPTIDRTMSWLGGMRCN